MSNTVGFSVQISVSGFDEVEGTRVHDIIRDAIAAMSREFDISSLEGVTVTANYRQAIAQFDNGIPGAPVSAPTLEAFGSGCAMAVVCQRGDTIKSHVFLDASIGADLLLEETDPKRALAVNILIHELAHVYDYAINSRELANARFPNYLTRWLYLLTNSTWSEYFACYFTHSTDPSLDDYVTLFLSSLKQCPIEIETAVYRDYRGGDIGELLEFVRGRVGMLFKFAGYVLGHLAGKDLKLPDTHPEAWQTIKDAEFADIWQELEVELRQMLNLPVWKDVSVYDGLAQCALTYLRSQGMTFEDRGNDFNVHVRPYQASRP